MRPILECRKLTKKYGTTFALSCLDLSLERGQIVGLLGPNGSGKSTLIKLAAGVLQPTQGEILLNGLEPGVETKKFVSYLPDRSYLSRQMRVDEVITYYKTFYKNFRPERASKMLDALEIDRRARLSSLSKGTLEKVQFIFEKQKNPGAAPE